MFDEDRKVVDSGQILCTKMKTNRRVIFPPCRSVRGGIIGDKTRLVEEYDR